VDAEARVGSRLWCCALELSGERTVDAVVPFRGQPRARVLVRLHGEPLGYLTVPTKPDGIDVPAVAAEAGERFGTAVAAQLAQEGLRAGGVPAPTQACPNRVESDALVSVVVCTRDRPQELRNCLERLRALTHPNLEVVVVDNAPSDERTRTIVAEMAAADPRFRYVREDWPGLAAARNRGLAEARGAILAYTDDDVTVDPRWVQGLLRGFARDDRVVCVTGLVCTADISSPAEEYFDARAASWSTRCEPELFDLAENKRPGFLYPYSAGIFGTGANFAFDRAFLERLGGFDEALGAGTPTRGGEDLDVFVRVLRAGGALAYEPAAMVWHHHRADDDALMKQLYGYGTGLSAFLTKCLLQAGTRGELLRRVPAGLGRMVAIRRQTADRFDGAAPAPADPSAAQPLRPARALRQELRGFVAGPVLYLRARRAARGRRELKPPR
jgi:GT2 family glycosyltransferase